MYMLKASKVKEEDKEEKYALEQVRLMGTCHDTKRPGNESIDLAINDFITNLEVSIKVCKCYLVSFLNRTPNFDWCMSR